MTGWVTAIPYAVGPAFMVWYGYRSDEPGERKGHAAVALAIAAAGIAGSTLTGNPTLTVIAFAIGGLRRVRDAAGLLDAADRRSCPARRPPPASP